MTKAKKSEGSMGKMLFAAGAAALGTYFLYGKDGAKNRKKVKSWMLKAKGEVLEKLEKADVIDEDTYHKAVDTMAKKYRTLKNVDPNEVEEVIADLKKHWKRMMQTKPAGKGKVAAKKKTKTKESV